MKSGGDYEIGESPENPDPIQHKNKVNSSLLYWIPGGKEIFFQNIFQEKIYHITPFGK